MSQARHARRRRSRRVVRTLSIAGLGAGITAVGAGSAFATDYTVKPGDTLSEIAQANGADWHQLAELNNLRDPDLILIGQTLRLDGVQRSAAQSERRATKTDRHPRKIERKAERSNRSSANRPRKTTSSGSANMSAAWRKVAECESGGNPRAVNGAGYYGLFQFDKQTWRSVGGSGNPADASASEQLARAKALYAQRGAAPWPVCGRALR
ncbi:MAG TPA: transglycosylase family protein [Kribbella sp.]|nr:transglycosylase family protein [Kribbella sp.]